MRITNETCGAEFAARSSRARPSNPPAVGLQRLLFALLGFAVLASSPAMAERTGSFKVSDPKKGGKFTVALTNDWGGWLGYATADIPDPCNEQTKAELIYEALRKMLNENEGKFGQAKVTWDGKSQVTLEDLPDNVFYLKLYPKDTEEPVDQAEVLTTTQGAIAFEGTFDPYDVDGRPATFTAGIVTDVGELTEQITSEDLGFQTDGPIICQALFQRLQPRAPQFGAQINYAGDRLDIYFDPAYTVTSGGVIFGTTSPGEGCSGRVLLPPVRLYVDDTAVGANSGTTWPDAFVDLQSALYVAKYVPTVREIWVAEGIYRPDAGTRDRYRFFSIVDRTKLFGGFEGIESSLDQRDPLAFPTILSGDLNGDDEPDFVNYADNSYHVVVADGLTDAVLDGFTVTGGNADGVGDPEYTDAGGGIRIASGELSLANCQIRANRAKFGGGVECFFTGASITDCVLADNQADDHGGGLHGNFSDASLRGCRFERNHAADTGGGARFVRSAPVFNDCAFDGNRAENAGGGISLQRSPATILNSTFLSNEAGGSGGGANNQLESGATYVNCVLAGNRAGVSGGGLRSTSSTPSMTNCTVADNRGSDGGGIYAKDGVISIANSILHSNQDSGGQDESAQIGYSGAAPSVHYSDVQGWTGSLGGNGNFDADPRFVVVGRWDDNGTPDDPSDDVYVPGDLQLCPGSPCIDRGDSAALPQDSHDLDGDGLTTELLPLDLLGLPRQLDDAGSPDGGAGDPPALDLGPYEFRATTNVRGDSNGDGQVDFDDIDCFVAAIIGQTEWEACSGLSGDRYLDLNDINRDGSVDFADIDAFVDCLINGGCAGLAEILLWPDTLTFWDVPRGESEILDLLVFNFDCEPLRLTSAELVNGVFFSIEDFDPVIPPYSFTYVPIRFTTGQADGYADTLLIETDPPASKPLEVAVTGYASDPVESDPQESAKIDANYEAVRDEDDGVHVYYTSDLPPLGPTQREIEMRLGIYGNLPHGVEPRFSQDRVPLGRRQVSNLELYAPPGTPMQDAEFVVTGDVYEGDQYLFSVWSSQFSCPAEWWDWVLDPCDCPEGTPAPSLNELDKKSFEVPDYGPPVGKKPSEHPVALATAVVKGPKAGECCKGAKFEMTFTVDSQVAGANVGLSAWFLLSGLCKKNSGDLTAETNGVAQGIDRGPGDGGMACAALTGDVGAVPRVVVQTTKTVDVKCELDGEKCPCTLAGTKFVTKMKFKLNGHEGELEVHWSISLKGDDCVISEVKGTIDRIIFTRSGKVYDPKNDEFDDPAGDKDSDSKSNYEEVKNGTDPKDPNSK